MAGVYFMGKVLLPIEGTGRFASKQKFFYSAMDFLAKFQGLVKKKKKRVYLKFHFDVQTQLILRRKSSLNMKVSY